MKKNKQITKKERIKTTVFVLSFLFFRAVISDWEHFKQGFLGLPYH